MKTALIVFRSLGDEGNGKYLDDIISIFKTDGFSVDRVEILSTKDDLAFSRTLAELKDVADNLIVIHNAKCEFNVKQGISDSFESPLAENDNALTFVQAVSKATGKIYLEEYASIPVDATLIPNINGAYQGFMMDDAEFTLAVLPESVKEIGVMVDKYLTPYLEAKYNLKRKRITLKYVGDEKKAIEVIEQAKTLSDCPLTYTVKENYGDFKIQLIFDNFEENDGAIILRQIIAQLKNEIYAEYDVGLSERLFDLLNLRKLKMSTAESFTSGRVGAKLLENSGASNVFHEGVVCYSNKSKVKRLGVRVDDLTREGAVSSIVAYQMAVGLLAEPECNIAVATTGIAGPKSDDTDKPVGLCYIAIGMRDGVHTYKLNLSGSREEITEKATNKALFLAIKRLKSI